MGWVIAPGAPVAERTKSPTRRAMGRMPVEGMLAYPILLAGFFGVSFVGRGEPSGLLERVRLAVMAVILGAATAIQVALVLMGVATAWSVFFGLTSLGGAYVLAGARLLEQLRLPRALLPGVPV